MSFFKKLFGLTDKKDNPGNGPMPTREINLQFNAIAVNGPKLAQQFVDAVRSNDNIALNFSIDTVTYVDKFLQRFRDEGLTVNDFCRNNICCGKLCWTGNDQQQQWDLDSTRGSKPARRSEHDANCCKITKRQYS
ncbi:hypothetical protein [Flavihumibacter sp. UBA7668]|uniref:hypothetical protein n=1 Tax=Flavihumibacter sp. UBA7668 TaxID=1946542 RepID=UPI0025BC390B|nr:hypothetical protein [Flavihumibacter sp. UBA7668]